MRINSFTIFIIIGTIIFATPAQIQVPLRVLTLLLLNLLVFYRSRSIIGMLFIWIITITYVLFKIKSNTFDTSVLMVTLSLAPVYYFSKLQFKLSKRRFNKLKKILYLWLFFIVIQMMFFRYNGRPTLSYEINQSGSYLFLFYLLAGILNLKYCKLVICFLALLLLSRLLILCIIIFEVIKIIRRNLNFERIHISYPFLILTASALISVFSIWYYINMSGKIVEGSDNSSRLTQFNDGSNYLRFKINSEILFNLISNEDDELLKVGYGDLAKNKAYRELYFLMPHNELFKAIAQFGIWFTLMCFLISMKGFKKELNYNNIEYIIPIILYTMILWVRFTIVPSLEMLFILYILYLSNVTKTNFNIHYGYKSMCRN